MQSRISKKVLRYIDSVPLGRWAIFAAVVVIGCGAHLYRSGLLRYSGSDLPVSFGNALYFSVVTFTSLGYGDIVPIGHGKAVAAAEVLSGLAFLGIAVAKLSSVKQNYHLAQLYARDAQERIDSYVRELRETRAVYAEALKKLRNNDELSVGVGRLHTELAVRLLRIRTYMSFEIANGDLLNEIPIGVVARLLQTCTRLSRVVVEVANFHLSQTSETQRRHAKRVLQEMSDLASLCQSSTDKSIRSELYQLKTACQAGLSSLNQMSEKVAALVARRRTDWH